MEGTLEWLGKSDNIKDHLVYAIICIEDNTILVEKRNANGVVRHSLISTTLKQNEGWNDAGRCLARKVKYDKPHSPNFLFYTNIQSCPRIDFVHS